MIELPYDIKVGKKTLKPKVPTSWREVTEAQANAWTQLPKDDPLRIMEILTGVPYIVWQNMDGGIFDEMFTSVAPLLAEDIPNFEDLPKPDTITIRGKEYSTDLDPNRIPMGYLEIMRQKLQEIEEATPKDEKPAYFRYNSFFIAYALAGQVFTRIDKEAKASVPVFNESLADELVHEVSQLPMIEVFPIGTFFLPKLLVYFGTRVVNFQLAMTKTKSKAELKTSRNSAFFPRWKHLLKVIGLRRNST